MDMSAQTTRVNVSYDSLVSDPVTEELKHDRVGLIRHTIKEHRAQETALECEIDLCVDSDARIKALRNMRAEVLNHVNAINNISCQMLALIAGLSDTVKRAITKEFTDKIDQVRHDCACEIATIQEVLI